MVTCQCGCHDNIYLSHEGEDNQDLNDGHDHVTIRVDRSVREALHHRLFEPDMVGVGYTEFIRRAIEASRSLRDIQDAEDEKQRQANERRERTEFNRLKKKFEEQ